MPSLKTRLQKVTEEIQKLRDVIEEVRDFNPVCNNDNKDPPLKGGGGAENALQCLAIDICVCCFDRTQSGYGVNSDVLILKKLSGCGNNSKFNLSRPLY